MIHFSLTHLRSKEKGQCFAGMTLSNQQVKKEEQDSKNALIDPKTQGCLDALDRVARAVRPPFCRQGTLGRSDRHQEAVRPPGAEKSARGGQTAPTGRSDRLESQFLVFLQIC